MLNVQKATENVNVRMHTLQDKVSSAHAFFQACEVVMSPSMTPLIVTWCVCKQCVPCVALGPIVFVIMAR